MKRQVHGILLLDKSPGMTSNGALQKAKRLFNAKKAGHTGSLDPIATGMLPICFGEATKFSQFLLNSDKSYYVTAKLGMTTTTGDSEGSVLTEKPVTEVTRARVEQVLSQLTGKISQIPPMFSAIKHQGKPLYELARRGIEVERKPREITIFSLRLHQLEADVFTFSVHCSKGTYIRTLVEEIGCALGCGAHVIGLRRMAVTPYSDTVMHTLSDLEAMAKGDDTNQLLSSLLPVDSSVQCFPAVKLTTSAAFYLTKGQPVRASFPMTSAFVRLFSENNQFLGVGEVLADGRVKPLRLLAR